MGFKLNLTNDEIKQAQGGGFPTLPAGTYGALIFENTFKYSKATPPNPMFEVNFKIVEGPAGINRKLKGWFVLSGKGLFKIVELHKALGGEDEGFAIPSKSGEYEFPEPDAYLGKKLNVVLDVQEYASVADENDVKNGTLNSETGQPVRKEGEPVTKTRNGVKNVRPYDPDTITTAEDLENDDEPAGSEFML